MAGAPFTVTISNASREEIDGVAFSKPAHFGEKIQAGIARQTVGAEANVKAKFL